jgi:hypothetical protein
MASTSLVGLLLARWYVTVMGILLSLVLAAVAFSYFPVQYSSSATAVLVPPKLRGINPMLGFDAGVSTTALVLVQALDSPEVADKLGILPAASATLHPGQDTYTVTNDGSVDLRDDGVDRPFFTITAQSLTPERSEGIVAQVLDEARVQLDDRQASMHVSKASSLGVQTVAGPTPADVVLTTSLKAVGIALVLGLSGTVVAACAVERTARRRQPGTDSKVSERVGHQAEHRGGADPLSQFGEGAEPLVDRRAPAHLPKGSFPAGGDAGASNGQSVGFDRIV